MVEFNDVLLVDDAGEVQLGTPFVEGARVVAEVIEQGRDAKILVFKYKNKTRYRRRKGHRQAYTRVAVRQILTGGQQAADTEAEKPARRPRRRSTTEKSEEPAAGEPAPITEGVTSLAAAATIDEGPTMPRRAARTRKAGEPSTATIGESPSDTEAKPARRPRTQKRESGE
jgi:large subunit ribosomal protein L21